MTIAHPHDWANMTVEVDKHKVTGDLICRTVETGRHIAMGNPGSSPDGDGADPEFLRLKARGYLAVADRIEADRKAAAPKPAKPALVLTVFPRKDSAA